MKATVSTSAVSMLLATLASASLHGCARVEKHDTKSDVETITPRRGDGKPDLNGIWTDEIYGIKGGQYVDDKANPGAFLLHSRSGGLYEYEIDIKLTNKGQRNKPMYRPEYWEKVRYLELNSLKEDSGFNCQPWGVPRLGAPQQIVHQGNLVVFLYSGQWTVPNAYRVILLNRPHNLARVAMQMSRGDSVGRWEGDTLVVDTTGLSEDTWLTEALGYFHTTDLHVIERFTRVGKSLKYEVTVEDPTVLLEPWVLDPKTITLNPDPDAVLPEDWPCASDDANHTPVR